MLNGRLDEERAYLFVESFPGIPKRYLSNELRRAFVRDLESDDWE